MKKKIGIERIFISAVGGLLLLPLPALASTYYVSTSGSDSNNGTSTSTPFKTLPHAASVTNPGDTVNVMSGTYTNACTGCDVVDITRSGSASGGYITYQAYPGQTPVIEFSGSWMAFNIQASYIVINGFTIEGLDEPSLTLAEAQSLGESSPKTNNTGIVVGNISLVTPFTHIVIEDNQVSNCSEAGIEVMRSDYVTIKNNIVHDNSWWSPYGGSGISLGYLNNSDSNTGYKNYIENNISYNNIMKVVEPAAGNTYADGNGIIIDDNENDQVKQPEYNGRTLVQNNVAYLNGGTGMHAFHSQHVDFVNNTAYMNNQSSGNSNGQISGVEVNDVNIVNNILYGIGTSKPITMAEGSSTNFVFNYNVVYNGSVSITSPNDIDANPDFVNASEGNFQLTSSSPAVNAAHNTTLAPTTDVLGVARPSGKATLGAYQYVGVSASPSPSSSPSPSFVFVSGSVSPSTARPGQTVTFTDTITSKAAASNVIFFTQLQNAAGTVVASQSTPSQNFTAAQTKTFTTTYVIPTTFPVGSYYHSVTIFNSTYKASYFGLYDTSTLIVALPDLIVTSVGMSPANPNNGQHVFFNAVIKNQGSTATAAGDLIGVAFDLDGAEVTWSAGDSTSLAPGASVSLWATGGVTNNENYWVAKTGTHTLLANVNDVKRFSESSFTNNTLTKSFTVP